MPLSEHEQRILEEIERRLAAEDPKFARSASAVTPRGVAVKRMKHAVAGFVLGLALLLSGLFVTALLLPLGLAGFVVMLTSLLAIARVSREMSPLSLRSQRASKSWFGRAEQRWRRRFERGDR